MKIIPRKYAEIVKTGFIKSVFTNTNKPHLELVFLFKLKIFKQLNPLIRFQKQSRSNYQFHSKTLSHL